MYLTDECDATAVAVQLAQPFTFEDACDFATPPAQGLVVLQRPFDTFDAFTEDFYEDPGPGILAELAPEHKKGYFRHAAQLVAAGVDHTKTWAPKTSKDGSHPHTNPTLTRDQFLSLPRSTRDFVRHHNKPEAKVNRWEAPNAKAAKQGWVDLNDRDRAKGHNVPKDNPSRAHIAAHYNHN
ncbi:hypothetical protein CYMTET_10671 [Cymbomonas tetramitiformis]|uniref:Uncharacterized protein n=1 Tax=Cymbomonas tetramitiformis TaxID=36881 RepID=A0AAE0GQ81_9CHLO|nr:hypothetical protein CYMTET_10671 [Cymbomonas tetramitiformis]